MTHLPSPGPLARLAARVRSLIRGLFRRGEIEEEMQEEFRHHMELRTEDLVRRGLPPGEAARQARLEFGHVETHRERARASRGLHVFDQIYFSWIDVRLGLRLLVKHPWLTLAAVFALAVGIPVGLAPTHLSSALDAPLPEDPGNRVRGLRHWDPATNRSVSPDYRTFVRWSGQLRSFSTLGAFRVSEYNLASPDGRAAPVAGAEVTASTFDILGTPPLLGRTLDAADEGVGAPHVVLIGHEAWVSRFGSDPGIVGRTVRIGPVPYTVVGVMPRGFLFPTREQAWLPLPKEGLSGPGRSAAVQVFGRLADGVSDDEALAELAVKGVRAGPTPSTVEARQQSEVVVFSLLYMDLPRGGLSALPEFVYFQGLALLLLLVACGNVAMLVFARTATRFRELAVRTALGAGRARIVSQIFAETLVLAVVAATVGVASVNWLLGHVNLATFAGVPALPYWLSLSVTPSTFVRALILAAVSATVAGVVPALRITGRGIQQNIRRAEAGRSGIRFGGITGALVVADIALSVAAMGVGLGLVDRIMQSRAGDAMAGIAAEEYLAVEVRMPRGDRQAEDPEAARAFTQRMATTQRLLVDRLEAEPGVRRVAVADALPRMDHRWLPFEVEGIEGGVDAPAQWVRTVRVDVDFFDALGRPILAGRDLDRADLEARVPPVIVNTVFVDQALGGRDPIGQRVRFVTSGTTVGSSWHEVIGVVGHLGANMVSPEGGAAVYVPAAPGTLNPAQLGIHTAMAPEILAARVREIAAEVDPDVVLGRPVVLSDVHQGDWYILVGVATGLLVLVGVLVTLAVSGIYAMMSFSVSERTREIGIRTALGAPRGALVLAIVRRSLVQIAAGALLGSPVAAMVFVEVGRGADGSVTPLALLMTLALAAGVVIVVALVSCLVPTRRVLRVEASEALRAEG